MYGLENVGSIKHNQTTNTMQPGSLDLKDLHALVTQKLDFDFFKPQAQSR